MVYYNDVWKERDWTNVIIFEDEKYTLTPLLKEITFYSDSRDLRAFIFNSSQYDERSFYSVIEIFEHNISGAFGIDYVRTTNEKEFEPPYSGHRFLVTFHELPHHKIVSGNQKSIETPLYMALMPSELLFTPQLTDRYPAWRKDSISCPFENSSLSLPRQANITYIPEKL
jgi:hypothetical protein